MLSEMKVGLTGSHSIYYQSITVKSPGFIVGARESAADLSDDDSGDEAQDAHDALRMSLNGIVIKIANPIATSKSISAPIAIQVCGFSSQ